MAGFIGTFRVFERIYKERGHERQVLLDAFQNKEIMSKDPKLGELWKKWVT